MPDKKIQRLLTFRYRRYLTWSLVLAFLTLVLTLINHHLSFKLDENYVSSTFTIDTRQLYWGLFTRQNYLLYAFYCACTASLFLAFLIVCLLMIDYQILIETSVE